MIKGPDGTVRKRPTMPVILQSSLIVAHTIGVLVAGIAAVFDIQTIFMWSGPIMSLTGILVAVQSYRARRPIGFGFGLTAATVAPVWFLIVIALEWSPADAHLPVSLFLIVFALASIPGGVFCSVEVLTAQAGIKTRFQFSIRTLLSVTFFVALYLGILRAFDVFGRLFSLWSHGSTSW